MSLHEKIRKWRRAGFNLALASALAVGLSASVKPQEAQANHKWVGPAIAGLVLGAAIGSHVYRGAPYYSTHYAPYPYAYPKRKYRKVVRHRHRHPPVVYAAPYPYYYQPYRPYYPYPRAGLSITIGPRWW